MTRYIGPKTNPANLATQNDLGGGDLLSGSGAPSSGLGADGDFYIDTDTDQLYGPKASGSWPSPISLGGGESRGFAVFIG